MNSYLYLKISHYKWETLVKKLRQINVSILSMEKENDSLIIKINEKDYDKIKKYLKTVKFKKLKYTGPKYYSKTFKRYSYIFVSLIIAILLVILSSFFIVDIKVVHDNEEIVSMLLLELEEEGIKKFTFKKSYEEIERIKNKIKDNHLDKIDWLEINKVGMKYIVRIEERIINTEVVKDNYCHMYATKDGLITRTKTYYGENKVEANDYVKAGDMLISGDITLNNKSVSKVCAYGKVYAEVWYTVNVKVPLEYHKSTKTGKKRNNIVINYNDIDHKVFNDRLENYEAESKKIFDALGIKIYLESDYEVIKEKHKYTEDEAIKEAIKQASDKIKLTQKEGERILSQKVLQKTINDSTIDIDIFIVAEEEIGAQKVAKEE